MSFELPVVFRAGEPPACHGEDLKSPRMVLGARESGETGKPVNL